jgi:hypothetical protein
VICPTGGKSARSLLVPLRLAPQGGKIALREKSNLSNGFNLIWVVQSQGEKYFASVFPKSMFPSSYPASTKRGVSRSSRTWRRDAMDAMSQQTNDDVADGEVVWSWRPDAGAKFAKSANTLRG